METTRSARPAVARAWHRGLGWHAAVLAVLLVLVGLAVGFTGSFSSDEGAVLLESKLVAEDGSWLVTNPVAELDPTGDHFPSKLPDGGPVEFAPYARHPLHVLVAAPVLDHLGVPGVILLSIAAAVAAALAAGMLAGLVQVRLTRPAFWVAGGASQLFFDAQVVMAHTAAAACCGWATYLVMTAVAAPPNRERRPGPWLVRVAAALVIGAFGVLLRSEAVLFLGAFALALLLWSWRRRAPRAAIVGGVVGVVTLGVVFAERRWYAAILGSGLVAPPNGASSDIVTKAAAAVWSLVGPVRQDPGLLAYVATGVLVLVVMAGVVIRRPPSDLRAASLFLFGAAAVALLGLFAAEPDPITGVLPAFPALAFALVLFRRRFLTDPVVLLLTLTFGIYALAVLATSYDVGGGAEWGGRYFSAGFPVLVVLVVVSLAAALPWDRPAARRCVLGLVAVSVAFAALAAHELSWAHRLNDGRTVALSAMIDAAGPTTGPDLGDGDRRPIVLQTSVDAGRFAWDDFDRSRGIQVAATKVTGLLDQLAARGATSAVLQADDLDTAVASVGAAPGWRVAAQADGLPGHGGSLLVAR